MRHRSSQILETLDRLRPLALALRASLQRRQGDLSGSPVEQFVGLSLRRRGVEVAPARVDAFRLACGLPPGPGELPATMPQSLFLGPIVELVASPACPLTPLGLVHVRQTMELRRAVPSAAPLDLDLLLDAARETERGVEVDLACEVALEGESAWRGTMTVLSRSAAARSRGGRGAPGSVPDRRPDHVVEVPADQGRRYAAASGDWSPHHIHPATARLVGFRRPIAHGMWTLARALGLLPRELAAPARVTCAFKRPLPLPGRMAVGLEDVGDGRQSVQAWDPKTGVPFLAGEVATGGG